MNKGLNTVIFMICATLVNLLLIVILFVILVVLASLALNSDSNSSLVTAVYGLSILLSIAGGFFIYNRLIKWVNNKWNLEQYILTSFRRPKK